MALHSCLYKLCIATIVLMISHCPLHGFEFRVVFLHLLPTKAREPSLLCYLTQNYGKKIHSSLLPFLKMFLLVTKKSTQNFQSCLNSFIFSMLKSPCKYWLSKFHCLCDFLCYLWLCYVWVYIVSFFIG